MSTIKSVYLQHLNGTTPNATMDTNGNFTVGGTVSGASSNMFRNRIINGDMRIDQRNAGAAVTYDGSAGYSIDRYYSSEIGDGSFSVQKVADGPAGFTHSLKVTVTAAQTGTLNAATMHIIEGLNIADFAWGTASAKTVTLSFWIKSSVTGTMSGAILNSAQDRSYVFSYTINAANTWEYKTITLLGDTTGTWNTDNTTGLTIRFSHGTSVTSTAGSWLSGNYRGITGGTYLIQTNGATWQITGLQIEVGTAATPFEFRHFTTELQLCQRYFEMSYDAGYSVPGSVTEAGSIIFISPGNVNRFFGQIIHTVQKRATPTVTMYSTTGASGKIRDITASADMTVVNQVAFGRSGVAMVSSAGTTAASDSVVGHYTASAEL